MYRVDPVGRFCRRWDRPTVLAASPAMMNPFCFLAVLGASWAKGLSQLLRGRRPE